MQYLNKLIIFICILTFNSCYRNIDVRVEGLYYRIVKYEGNKLYSFIEIKGSKYISDHGLYNDIERDVVYREPYQPEILDYMIEKNVIVISDPSYSYEVEKITLLKKEVITKSLNLKVQFNYKREIIGLKNSDLNITYLKY